MMKRNFRAATPSDLNGIATLAKSLGFSLGDDIPPEEFILAIQERKIIGFCRLQTHGDKFELSFLGVEKTFRQQGIGQALVREQLKKAKGCVYLNTIIPEYFEKLGFRIITKAIPDFLAIDPLTCRDCPKERCRAMVLEKAIFSR
jgi:N-acetylglutamate synthase-like GNAT family acetyltransferase